MQEIKQMKRDKEPKRREEQGKRDSKKLCTLILEKETHYYYCDGYQGVILVLIFVTNSHHFSLRTLSNGLCFFQEQSTVSFILLNLAICIIMTAL